MHLRTLIKNTPFNPKKHTTGVLYAFLVLLLFSCSGYTKKDGKVYLRSSDEAHLGVNYLEMKDADYESFETIKTKLSIDLARDKNHVFIGSFTLKDADPSTFQAIREFYWKDKHHVFLLRFGGGDAMIPSADPSTFELLDDNLWAKDKNNIYYSFTPLSGIDKNKFTAIDDEWGKDGQHYFWHEFRLDSLDYQSVKILGPYYIRDKHHVYFHNELVTGCNAASFVTDGAGSFGHDERNMFSGTKNDGPITDEYRRIYMTKK